MKTTKCEQTTEPYGGTCDLRPIAACQKCGKQVCLEHLHVVRHKDYAYLCHSCSAEIFKATKAFTLVELMVVVTIITLLAGMLLPALAKAKTQAKIAMCRSNQRQLLIALSMYRECGYYPPMYTFDGGFASWMRLCDSPEALVRCPDLKWGSIGLNAFGSFVPLHEYMELGLQQAKESSVARPVVMVAVVDGNNPYDANFSGERHSNSTQNIGFCDGHVETLNRAKLSDTNSLACLWNKDNQVHEETWR